jgi:hypothetical protein
LILKLIWKFKWPWITKTIWKGKTSLENLYFLLSNSTAKMQ